MTITGTIIELTATETIGATQHQKRTVVIQVNGEYPKTVPIEFWNKHMSKLDNFGVGQTATVEFDIDGKKSGERWYSSNKGWKITAE